MVLYVNFYIHFYLLMIQQFLQKINNQWFFEEPSSYLRYLLVFVKGDALVILPFFALVFLFGFISLEFMVIMIGIYIAVRSFGEMIFWMLQQFGPRTYRPFDFGLNQLDNNAIYILYQLIGMVGTVLGICLTVMMIYF